MSVTVSMIVDVLVEVSGVEIEVDAPVLSFSGTTEDPDSVSEVVALVCSGVDEDTCSWIPVADSQTCEVVLDPVSSTG